jgi:hypothetical protein
MLYRINSPVGSLAVLPGGTASAAIASMNKPLAISNLRCSTGHSAVRSR